MMPKCEERRSACAGISVITATYNAGRYLPELIESLMAQSDRDFEWVVADGGSTDNTIDLVKAANGLRVKVLSQPDFGIYDALNRGIRASEGLYYIVVGADDRLDINAIANFRQAIVASSADIVTAARLKGSAVVRRRGRSWMTHQFAYVSGHSVGTAFRKELHERVGYYSRRFPIAADQLFIMSAIKAGASIFEAKFVAGKVGQGGVSSTDIAGTLSEAFRVQLALGKNKAVQVLLYVLRLIRHYRRL